MDGFHNCHRHEHPGQHAQVVPPFHVVLDPPEGSGDGSAQRVVGDGNVLPRPRVEDAVVRRVAEHVGQEEGEDVARGPRPAQDLSQGGRALAKVVADEFVQGEELDAAHSQADECPHGQPDARPQGRPQPPHRPPGEDHLPQAVGGQHDEGVVQDLHVPGQNGEGQHHGQDDDIGRGVEGMVPLLPLFAEHEGNQSHQQGQPRRGGDDHGEDDADDEEAGELVGHAGEGGRGPAASPKAGQRVHAHPGQGQLQPGEHPVGHV